MQMLQPMQYQSMFIPSNIDLMNQNLMKREQEYAQNEAALAQAQDQYAQVAADPSAVEYKNQILSQFQGDVNKMIEDYGGDLGAIDRRTLINKMNSIRPEVQKLQRHAVLKEEERKLRQQYGPWAIETGIAEDLGVGDPVYNVKNKMDYIKDLSVKYAKEAGRRRESKIDDEGYQTTYLGVTNEELPGKIQEMAKNLTDTDPSLDPTVALEIASEFAPQLMQGWTREFRVQDQQSGLGAKTGIYPMIDWMSAGVDSGGDKSLTKTLTKSLNARVIDVYADMAQPRNYIGTKAHSNLKKEDPIVSMFEKSVLKDNKMMSDIIENPFDITAGGDYTAGRFFGDAESIATRYTDKGTDPATELRTKYKIDVTKLGENAINKAEMNYNAGGPGVSDFDTEILNELSGAIQVKTGLSDVESRKYAQDLKQVYDKNQSIYKTNMRSAIKNIEKSGVLPSNMFNFQTFDMATKNGSDGYNYVNNFVDNEILTPNNMTILTGDYKGKDNEKLRSLYKKNKTKPNIKAIGFDDQHEPMFIVKGPEGEDVIAQFDVDRAMVDRLALSMGRAGSFDQRRMRNAFNNLKSGDLVYGYKAQPYNTNGTRTVSLQDDDGNSLTVGQVRQLLNVAGISNDNIYMSGAQPNMPYQFKSPELMINLLEFLNKKK